MKRTLPEFDGSRFRYPGNETRKSLRDMLRWMATRQRSRWPAHLDNPDPSPVVDRIEGDALRVTMINHATVLVQSGGVNILTDPVWSHRVSPFRRLGPSRHRKPGINFDALPGIDAVLISHGHYDHLDLDTLQRLQQRDAPLVITPLKHGVAVERVTTKVPVELDWWQHADIRPGIHATLVPARHWTSRWPGDANKALWGGYVLSLPGGAVYFAGDTSFGEGAHFNEAREHLGPFRLALLPIGAYEPRWFMRDHHMNPEEAVQAFTLLQAQHAMAIHFGTFQLTDEAHDAPLTALAVARKEQGVHDARFRALLNGEAWDIPTATTLR